MGGMFTRENHRVENIEITATSDYYYPPKNGNYFADHFTMGGEKFKANNPECFLFGENSDLAYLSSKPSQFPYKPPSSGEPSRSLRTLVHLRKDSLRMNRATCASDESQIYTLEFTLDSDVECSVQVFLFASENLGKESNKYTARNKEWASSAVRLSKGTNQNYSTSDFQINFDQLNVEEFEFVPGAPEIPVVIQLSVLEKDFLGQMEVTFATFERVSDGSFSIKPLKQKIMVDNLCYVIEEIYGIENKKEETADKDLDDDDVENGSECVICMCEMRDTLILPCRHLCLCNTCANSLRFQSSTCPICRSAFYALLQIKAVKRKVTPSKDQTSPDEDASAAASNTPVEYEEVPLIEALNGELGHSNGEILRRASSGRKSANRGRHGPRATKSAASGTSSRHHDPKHERTQSRASVKEKSRDDRTVNKSSKSDTLSCPNLRETALLMSANTSTDESDCSVHGPRSKSTFPNLQGNAYSSRKGNDVVLDCDSNDEVDGLDQSITLEEDILPAAEPSPPAESVPASDPVDGEDQPDSPVKDERENIGLTTPAPPSDHPGAHIVLTEQLSNSSQVAVPIDTDSSNISLPGTPMGSDDSSRSVSSISFHHLPIAVVNPIYNAAATPIADDEDYYHQPDSY